MKRNQLLHTLALASLAVSAAGLGTSCDAPGDAGETSGSGETGDDTTDFPGNGASGGLADSGPHDSSSLASQTLDDRFAAISRKVPEFGGMFLDEDQTTIYVYMTDVRANRVDAVRTHVAAEFATEGIQLTQLRIREGRYAFAELQAWYRKLVGPVLATPGVHMTDIDEARNRLAVHVHTVGAHASVTEQLDMLGIPADAVEIVSSEPVQALGSIDDVVTPRRGGTVITRLVGNQAGQGISFCTMGFNALRAKVPGFVTNSHCSEVFWGIDGQGGFPAADFYQSAGYYPAQLIGTEQIDPPGGTCPASYASGYTCRYSDSLFSTYIPTTERRLGVLAKTTGLTEWDGSTPCPGSACILDLDSTAALGLGAGQWAITQTPTLPLLSGLQLHKVGRSSGWTSGTVDGTCTDQVDSANRVRLCQWSAGNLGDADPSNDWWRIATFGDSGSPVFRVKDPARRHVELYGLLWGGSNFGNSFGAKSFVFSPIGGVIQDLGALNHLLPKVVTDFDGDGESELSVWRASQTKFWTLRLADGSVTSPIFGASGDIPVIGDYDGDRKSDYALWRPSTGVWDVLLSSTGSHTTRQWGSLGDIAVAGDFDNDGKTDFTVWRPSQAKFYTILSATGLYSTPSFGASGDIPVIGDYDGDGRHDYALWRPSTGGWDVLQTSTGTHYTRSWGTSGDIPTMGDFDGDGKTDLSVWRPSQAKFYTILSATGVHSTVIFGAATDVPIIGDYDGDHISDYALWRPSTGVWEIRQSSGGTITRQWGTTGDVALRRTPN